MKQEFHTMLVRTAVGLALIVATASGSLAATRTHTATAPAAAAQAQNVYNPYGSPVRTDPDPNVRFNLMREWDQGR
jgi:hypothetical protein